jgi:hypothetical protein
MRNQTSMDVKSNVAGLANCNRSLVVWLWHGAANAGGEYPFRPEHPHQRFPSAEDRDRSCKKASKGARG